MEYELTPEAIELGLGAALPVVFAIGKEREFGRGERNCASISDVPQTVRFVRAKAAEDGEQSA
jgi:hypothetical protein